MIPMRRWIKFCQSQFEYKFDMVKILTNTQMVLIAIRDGRTAYCALKGACTSCCVSCHILINETKRLS